MAEGPGGIGGMAEKVVPFVSFPILMRTVVPGLALCLGAAPYCRHLNGFPHDWQAVKDHQTLLAIIAIAAVIIVGTLWSTLGDEIYKLYEGRSYWPEWLFEVMRRREHTLVSGWNAEQNAPSVDARAYEELWEKLRLFPLDDREEPYAHMPTRLGNILRGYERYPYTRYGMDGVFYWPRLWLALDKDTKAEIEDSWSVADGLLMTSAALAFIAIVWVATTLLSLVPLGWLQHSWLREPLPASTGASLVAAFALMVLSYVTYRVSLPFHVRNGETFKSLFDLYRSKLKPMLSFEYAEAEQWLTSVYYLQYLYFPCPECKRTNSLHQSDHAETCSLRNLPVAELLKRVFPKQAPAAPSGNRV